jgi:hypothetical protein
VGRYEASSKVSRRDHLFSDLRKALWLREFDTNVQQRMLASMKVAAGLAHGYFPIRT